MVGISYTDNDVAPVRIRAHEILLYFFTGSKAAGCEKICGITARFLMELKRREVIDR